MTVMNRFFFRLYRLILVFYPRDFRTESTEEILDTVHTRVSEFQTHRKGFPVLLTLWVRESYAVMKTGLQMRFGGTGSSRPRSAGEGQNSGTTRFVETSFRHLRQSLRNLRKRPLFSGLVVTTLALGIGACTVIYSLVNGILIQSLPYPEADRLVKFYLTNTEWRDSAPNPRYQEMWDSIPVSYAIFNELKGVNTVCENIGVYAWEEYRISGQEHPEVVTGYLVSSQVWDILDIRPHLGRIMLARDDEIGAQRVALLSFGLWQRSFGADPDIVGRVLHSNEDNYLIVGVMPQDFSFPAGEAELFTSFSDSGKQSRSPYLHAIARLNPRISVHEAQREMEAATLRLEATGGNTFGARFVPLAEEVVGDVRSALMLLLYAVGAAFLIVSTTVANLLCVRAAERRRELAVRSALGESRGQLFLHIFLESLLVSVTGGILGLILAFMGWKPFVSILPSTLPRLSEIGMDIHVLLFAALLSVLAGICIGLITVISIGQTRLSPLLQGAGRSHGKGQRLHRAQAGFIILETALTFALMVGAGLVLKSFINLTTVERGFSSSNLLTFRVSPEDEDFSEQRIEDFHRLLTERLESLPAVRAVAGTDNLPFVGGAWTRTVTVDSQEGAVPATVEWSTVTGSFFQTMNIPLVGGRTFTTEDVRTQIPVVIVSQSLAQRFWPTGEALGRRIKLGEPERDTPWLTVVGIAGDVRHRGLDVAPTARFYLPVSQHPAPNRTIIVRADTDPIDIVEAVRNTVWSIEPELPVKAVSTLDDLIVHSVENPRFRTVVLDVIAALALTLSIVGIFGVLSYSVTQRRHEIGIRMALGARRNIIVMHVLKRGLLLTGLGLIIGLILTLGVCQTLRALLFEVQPADPGILLMAGALLVITAIAAGFIPACKAARTDALDSLKSQ